MTTPRPVTQTEFDAALGPLLSGGLEARPLAVAVSGGRDSLALMHLAAGFTRARGLGLSVLTVDHALRPESAGEAREVAAAAGALGLPQVTLSWTHGPLRGNLEAAAREARYRLMAEWCASASLRGVLLGHTQDDQAETVLLRLARGSGVDGLSAMAPRTELLGILLLRPLLDIPRARLEATLRALGQPWFDDPMNEDPRFNRVRIRQASKILEAAGLSQARLAATARAMARARQALESAAGQLMAEAVQTAPAGYCRLQTRPFLAAPDEIGLRALAHILTRVGARSYPPRLERLERLYRLWREGALGRGRTLSGCRILPARDGEVLVIREAAALDAQPVSLRPGTEGLWDGRFRVKLSGGMGRAPASVRPLGAAGWSALRRSAMALDACHVPAPVRPTLPSLWLGEVLVAVPHLNYAAPSLGETVPDFEATFTGL